MTSVDPTVNTAAKTPAFGHKFACFWIRQRETHNRHVVSKPIQALLQARYEAKVKIRRPKAKSVLSPFRLCQNSPLYVEDQPNSARMKCAATFWQGLNLNAQLSRSGRTKKPPNPLNATPSPGKFHPGRFLLPCPPFPYLGQCVEQPGESILLVQCGAGAISHFHLHLLSTVASTAVQNRRGPHGVGPAPAEPDRGKSPRQPTQRQSLPVNQPVR